MPTRGRRPLGSPDAREAVLGAARELFAELGFERTTMRAVAARADVDAALIYHYFGDKDGLLAAVVEPMMSASLPSPTSRPSDMSSSRSLCWASCL